MNYIIGGLVIAILGILLATRPTMKEQWDAGYKAGLKEALRTNPPSDDLEMVCAGLWLGEQQKKMKER